VTVHPDWPHRLLNVASAEAAGHRQVPFRQFVLKVFSRCNLACDYCYVYEMADQGWRHQPPAMSKAIMEQAIERIAEHARAHHLAAVQVVLHGGEPLLAGRAFIQGLARQVRRALPAGTEAELAVQTNGTRLDRPMLDALARQRVRVGVSIDGGQVATDRHRRYPGGRGSFASVARSLALLGSGDYREIYGGLLATISLDNDPVETYEVLAGFAPPLIDFLLPHGTWTTPPPSRPPDDSTPYADWLLRVFRHWTSSPRPRPAVRIFDTIIGLLLGESATTVGVGLAPSATIVIDADGAIKGIDALSAAYDGAADTGLNVTEHALNAALSHPTMVASQLGLAGLSPACLACPVRDVCGGGYYPHRYRAGDGFRNPSVYCRDLLALITAIREYTSAEVRRLIPGG
jgi:uncharacterized protein